MAGPLLPLAQEAGDPEEASEAAAAKPGGAAGNQQQQQQQLHKRGYDVYRHLVGVCEGPDEVGIGTLREEPQEISSSNNNSYTSGGAPVRVSPQKTPLGGLEGPYDPKAVGEVFMIVPPPYVLDLVLQGAEES
ncbi:hypothetical protein, conserved [Eimeria praecox]|uniref:Uncharacterized protein n=1 Tax=Eimeria praecox TaxID=51316 RepID=U6H5K0_9EIME|nr:hypothetical protein, conserved [Eimeria praecox]